MAEPGDPHEEGEEERPSFFQDIFQTRYREVTLSALILALIIGVIMNAAITYAGLKIGFTIGGSAIAAVLGFGVLRGILRKGTILETNLAQTCASAINTSNSGIIFTVPVLFLLGIQLSFWDLEFWLITLACVAGAVLGAAFIIPLRKQMIDIDRLRFPTGTGVAVILKSPGAGAKKSIVLLAGILLAAVIYLPVALPQIKSPASPDHLQDLFEKEQISWADVERTQAIARWIEDEKIPDAIIKRGEIVEELAQARRALAEQTERAERKKTKARIEGIENRLAMSGAGPLFGDRLCRTAAKIARGEEDAGFAALRDTALGWAKQGLPGYADLQVRLPATEMAGSPARDQNGDGNREPVLTLLVDQDRNGRADLILTDETFDLGRFLGLPDQYQLVFAIAPFALGAGFITGAAGLFVLAGGILAFFVLTPLAWSYGWLPQNLEAWQAPGYAFGSFNRPLGIGLLLGGALMGVAASLPAIKAALGSVAKVGQVKSRGSREELPFRVVTIAILGAILLLFLAADWIGGRPLNDKCPVTGDEIVVHASVETPKTSYQGYTIAFADQQASDTWEKSWDDSQRDTFLATYDAKPGWLAGLNPHLRSLIIALVGALWIWFAGIIIAQCTGMTDWSPISGMALLTVVLIMLLAGTGAVVGAVLIGAALCVAITLAADMMQDLRTGHLVGAQPRRQQVMELLVVGIGPAVSMIVILVIAQVNMKNYGVALGPETPTVAPQAQALQAVITGVQGGEMPYALYGFGALLGAVLGLGAFSGLGVLVGLSMYLPFMYIATYGIGCVVQMIMKRLLGTSWTEEWGVPFAAGLIVGEAILALVINLIVLAQG